MITLGDRRVHRCESMAVVAGRAARASGPCAPWMQSLARNDGDLAVLLQDGELDLVDSFEALRVPRRLEDVAFIDTGFANPASEHLAMLDYVHRHSIAQYGVPA